MLYPVFLKLDGHQVLVVGGGNVALAKIRGLVGTGAKIRVVAVRVIVEVEELARGGSIELTQRAFEEADVSGARVVIAATNDAAVNERIMRTCRERDILVNVVDDPARCDFFVPSVIDRGRLRIAVSTGGSSPGFARRLRLELESRLHPSLGRYVELLASVREQIRGRYADDEELRRRANEAVLGCDARQRLESGDEPGALEAVDRALAQVDHSEAEP